VSRFTGGAESVAAVGFALLSLLAAESDFTAAFRVRFGVGAGVGAASVVTESAGGVGVPNRPRTLSRTLLAVVPMRTDHSCAGVPAGFDAPYQYTP
jgi:hypothetical protein